MTQIRLGPKYGMEIPYYCPWCSSRINQDPYDHAYEHADKAPYAVDIVEEYWPPGLATHCFSEGLY